MFFGSNDVQLIWFFMKLDSRLASFLNKPICPIKVGRHGLIDKFCWWKQGDCGQRALVFAEWIYFLKESVCIELINLLQSWLIELIRTKRHALVRRRVSTSSGGRSAAGFVEKSTNLRVAVRLEWCAEFAEEKAFRSLVKSEFQLTADKIWINLFWQ